ncbi:xanthine dehydrogenase family protein molybdopterin-binding subunit [Amycolatopsis rubida]|uniref:Xanthine dehydrogenase family protein molybdopterin-binding subunit n=2 Tax=Pseudonocardiaceae TaxID=2070 RepID=A0ABX0BR08_9PSEU|nr:MULTISPECIES: xanthine dehydrogenase family protein molybdopterin-binding subunit [Amycolatopsis]MYW90774.1 molybdopterin-dependent oxidoreductase [Amycolatopsis rubida]NEC55757.1 xanthine dehydrogenase family protein molybdopterin-binding subunit [Amycolatopsis rubida]
MGTSLRRVEGPAKVTGSARYAAEAPIASPSGPPLYLRPVQATIPCGRITHIDTSAALALPGVVDVLTHDSLSASGWPPLIKTDNSELFVLQDRDVRYRGQYIAAVLAESLEVAQEGTDLVTVTYTETRQHTAFSEHASDGYTANVLPTAFPASSAAGDPTAALSDAAVTIRRTYTTPVEHHGPMEPHTTKARWDGNRVEVHESSQGVGEARRSIAQVFGLEPEAVTVRSSHVGGGFGTKGFLHAGTILAVLAARQVPGRSVCFALSRREMFETVGYRPATVQHLALGASADGRLVAITHDVVATSARSGEFAEPAAAISRTMYAAPHRRTSHRLVPLDRSVPTYMRAPGEAPGSFAAECAMDELALELSLDPIELRVRNEPSVHPESGLPFSSRGLVACLRQGAERFGWAGRDPAPRSRLSDGWWHGTGVAAATYPTKRFPGSTANIRFERGHYLVEIGAADMGQGARTVLTQIAADALGTDVERVTVAIGDTDLPPGSLGGGSSGTTSWGSTIVEAAGHFRDKWGNDAEDGAEADAIGTENPWDGKLEMDSYGAQFAEVAVHADTGEIRVPRLLGVFAAGRIINPALARSQLCGGMIWGLSMALHEESVVDPRFGHVVNHDFASYHIASPADIGVIDVEWIDEDDPYVNPMGAKGVGEIGIVGAAAAIANAAFHATGVRIRSLPITMDAFL